MILSDTSKCSTYGTESFSQFRSSLFVAKQILNILRLKRHTSLIPIPTSHYPLPALLVSPLNVSIASFSLLFEHY